MPKRIANLLFLIAFAGIFWLFSFVLNEWLCETMPRHQVMQLPVMFFLGIGVGLRFVKGWVIPLSWSIAVLIIVMASFIFWMLPHSIDLAVISASFNRIMHLNMIVAGFLLVPVLHHSLFEIKIIFSGMLAAMLIAAGITLLTFNILLCSAFTIEQQKDTGMLLLIIGLVLYAVTITIFFRGLQKNKEKSLRF